MSDDYTIPYKYAIIRSSSQPKDSNVFFFQTTHAFESHHSIRILHMCTYVSIENAASTPLSVLAKSNKTVVEIDVWTHCN